MCHEGGCGCCVVSLTQTDPSSSELVTKSVNSVSTKVLNVCILRLKLIFHQDKLFQPSLISYFSLLFNKLHKSQVEVRGLKQPCGWPATQPLGDGATSIHNPEPHPSEGMNE